MAQKKGVKVPVEVEPKVSESASQKAAKDIEKLKKQASAKPVEIQVKLDDSKMVESFNQIARSIQDALSKLRDQINRTFAGFHGTTNGFAEINKDIAKTGVQFSSFEQSMSHIENDIRLMSGAFRQLADGSTEIGGLTTVFERIGTEIGKVVSSLSSMTKMLSGINEKMNIDATRPIAIIEQDIETAKAKVESLKQELTSIGEVQLKGKPFDFEKYFNTTSVKKLIAKVFSATEIGDIPTAGLNKLQKNIAGIFTLPPDVIKNYKVQIGEVEYTLEDLATKFAQVSAKINGKEESGDFLKFDGRKQINQIRLTEQEIVNLTEETKVAQEYLNRGFNVQIDPSSIEALVTAMSSISELTAHLGEGTTLGIDPAQIESVVNAFTELKNILSDIYNLLSKSDIFSANTHIATDEINRINQALETTEIEAQKASDSLKRATNISAMADGGSALNLLETLQNEVSATEEIKVAQEKYNESVKQGAELVKQEETELQKLARLAFERDLNQTVKRGDVSTDWMAKAQDAIELTNRINEITSACMDVSEQSQIMKQELREAMQVSAKSDAGYGLDVIQEEIALQEALRESLRMTEEEYQKDYIARRAAEDEYKAATELSKNAGKKQAAEASQQYKQLTTDINKVADGILKLYTNGTNIDSIKGPLSFLEKGFGQFQNTVHTTGMKFEEARKHADNFAQMLASINQLAKSDAFASDKSINSLSNQMERFINPDINPRLSVAISNRVRELINSLTPGKTTISQLEKIRKEFGDIQIAAAKAGQTGANWFDGWKKRLASLSQYLTTFVSFYRIVGYVREAFDTINELDYALIDLRKTTTMTNEELEEFYHNSVNVGKQVGTTAKEIINQASAWSRLGYQTKEEATAMAELSAQFAAISPGMSLDKATDGLVSTMKAFHIDVDNVEKDVMDSINRIGNTMATSNEEVVEMLTRSSAAMNAANNSLAETIALESAAVQITRNAETTGTAFRTISMRIRGKLSMPPYVERHMLCYAI